MAGGGKRTRKGLSCRKRRVHTPRGHQPFLVSALVRLLFPGSHHNPEYIKNKWKDGWRDRGMAIWLRSESRHTSPAHPSITSCLGSHPSLRQRWGWTAGVFLAQQDVSGSYLIAFK